MPRHLVSFDQLRHNQIVVNEIPLIRLQPEERKLTSHSIIHQESGLHIPLSMDGTTSFFRTRLPTRQEIKDDTHCTRVHMTSDSWDPYDQSNSNNESAIRASLENAEIRDGPNRQYNDLCRFRRWTSSYSVTR